MFHLMLHGLVPLLVVVVWYRSTWLKCYLILMATMLVDIDHLLATPIYDPLRCSIGFHPLHSMVAIAVYVLMLAVPKLRLVAIGLLIHMALDGLDCLDFTIL